MSTNFLVFLRKAYFFFLVVLGLSSMVIYQNCGNSRLGYLNGKSSGLGDVGIPGENPDSDGDGLSDVKELEIGTDPKNEDTDNDGLKDGAEVNTYNTDPLDPDTDDGGVSDGAEVAAGTNPVDNPADDITDDKKDNDGDGLNNKKEKEIGTDPNNPDTDNDGLKDGEEVNTHGTDPLDPDTDDGGVTDGAEVSRGTNPVDNPADDFPKESDDPDKDGLTNSEENSLGTDPLDPDTDGDGLKDGEEVNTYNTNPLERDTDKGGVEDGAEVSSGTNPLDPSDDDPIDPSLDSDKDGLTDIKELTVYHTDPKNPDTDNDGLKDGEEVNTHKTNPLDPDTDDGGVIDGAEVSRGTNPVDNPADDFPVVDTDSDKDGLTDEKEKEIGTDPHNPDSDGDKLPDGSEVYTHKTNPLDPDTDDGGVYDGIEVVFGGDPLDPSDDKMFDENYDADGDGLTDKIEKQIGTDPNKPDTDGDGLTDGQEVNTHKTNPLVADTDGGGINDGDEVNRGTNPLDAADDKPLVAQCKKVERYGLWIDENNTKDITFAKYVGAIKEFSGNQTGAKNYNYYSASAHPIVGPQPSARQFKAFLYKGSDGLSISLFAGADNKGANKWQPANFKITVQGNGLADSVKLSDDAKELKLVQVLGDQKIYSSDLKYILNSDGGVIGPLTTNKYQINFEFNNTEAWDNAVFVSNGKAYSLGSGKDVKNFIVGYRSEIVCEDKAADIELVFTKAPDFMSNDMSGEFVFTSPNKASEKYECSLNDGDYQSCEALVPYLYNNLGAGTHKFNVMVTPNQGQAVIFEYLWTIVKPTPPTPTPKWSSWSDWKDVTSCLNGTKTQIRTRYCLLNVLYNTSASTQNLSTVKCDTDSENCAGNSNTLNNGCVGPSEEKRQISCDNPKPKFCTPGSKKACAITNGSGQQICSEDGMSYGICKVKSCNSGYTLSGNACVPKPVNGGWSDWKVGPWSDVTYKCGKRTLTRTCTNPKPRNGGANCVGSATKVEQKTCSTRISCGSYSVWSNSGACSNNKQKQIRTRTCTQYSGSAVVKTYQESQTQSIACLNCGSGFTYAEVSKAIGGVPNPPPGYPASYWGGIRASHQPTLDKACEMLGCGYSTKHLAQSFSSCKDNTVYSWEGSSFKHLPSCPRNAILRVSGKSLYCASPGKVRPFEEWVQVNSNVGPDADTACKKVGGVAVGCVSGERRPANATSISYPYGTWGGVSNVGDHMTVRNGIYYCWSAGQKKDYDRTDINVAYKCSKNSSTRIPVQVLSDSATNLFNNIRDGR